MIFPFSPFTVRKGTRQFFTLYLGFRAHDENTAAKMIREHNLTR